MYRLVVALVFSVIVSTISATDFYITSPYAATKWRQNETVKITWNLLPGGEEISSISIDLMDGDDNNASVVMNIASYITKDCSHHDWYIPCNLSPSHTYFIRLTGNGNTAIYRFSHRFSIEKGCDWHSSSTSTTVTSNSAAVRSTSTSKTSTSNQNGSSSTITNTQTTLESTVSVSATQSTTATGSASGFRSNIGNAVVAIALALLLNI